MLLAAAIAAAAPIASHSRRELKIETTRRSEVREYSPLYLPDARYVKLITLGHDTLAGDLLWFNTNSYFGRQMAEHRDVRWLGTMCGLITALDPHNPNYYEFCSSLLSWVANDSAASNKILNRAIKFNPTNWKYFYLRGFNYWYFMQDKKAAAEDFSQAAKLDGAPSLMASLASKLLLSTDESAAALELLGGLLRSTKDPSVRAVLIDKLKRAQLTRDIDTLNAAIGIAQRQGTVIEDLDTLVKMKIINDLPADPFGGKYFLDPATRTVKTTSGQKGLDFSGHSSATAKGEGKPLADSGIANGGRSDDSNEKTNPAANEHSNP